MTLNREMSGAAEGSKPTSHRSQGAHCLGHTHRGVTGGVEEGGGITLSGPTPLHNRQVKERHSLRPYFTDAAL